MKEEGAEAARKGEEDWEATESKERRSSSLQTHVTMDTPPGNHNHELLDEAPAARQVTG